MKKVPFELLQILIAVGESRNFREAATKLNISQPAVSLKLKELQTLQPLPLFSLEGKRKVLTHYGRALYELAKKEAVNLERQLENLHRRYSSEEKLTVRIGGRNEALEYISPFFDFKGKIELVGLSSQEAVDRLLRHDIDIAITHLRPDSSELHAKKLFHSKAYFCIHEKLLGKRKLNHLLIEDQEFLLGTPCVTYYKESHLISEWAQYAGLSFHDFQVKFTSEDWRTIQFLVERGIGYGILPSYVPLHSSEVRQIEIPERILSGLDFFAVYETGLKKTKAFQALLSFSKIPT